MFLVAVAVLFCFSSLADGFPVENCGTTLGNFSQIKISGCDKSTSACILHKGKNATIEIDFTTNEDASDLQTVVHGTLVIVPIPFRVPHPDACTDPDSGITCPLAKGRSYSYKATLPVQTDYPSVSVTVKWELQDQNGNDIVCVRLPAKIR